MVLMGPAVPDQARCADQEAVLGGTRCERSPCCVRHRDDAHRPITHLSVTDVSQIFTDYEMVRTVANDSANVRFRCVGLVTLASSSPLPPTQHPRHGPRTTGCRCFTRYGVDACRRARAQAARAENCFLSLDIAMFDLFTGAFGYGKPGLELARVRLRGTDREVSTAHRCLPVCNPSRGRPSCVALLVAAR